MDAETAGFHLRIPAYLARELEQEVRDGHLSATEIVLQGLALRLRAVNREEVPAMLEKIGYQARRRPGRPRRADLNGTSQAPGSVPEDVWSLDAGTST